MFGHRSSARSSKRSVEWKPLTKTKRFHMVYKVKQHDILANIPALQRINLCRRIPKFERRETQIVLKKTCYINPINGSINKTN